MSSKHNEWDVFSDLELLFKNKKKQATRVDDQSKWEEEEHLRHRSASIDKILSNYTTQQEERYKFKKISKICFVMFFATLASLIIVGSIALCVVAVIFFNDKRLEFLTCIITAIVTFFSSIVSILLIIVKYIFPADEETKFNDLVKIIVENDTERLRDINDKDKLL